MNRCQPCRLFLSVLFGFACPRVNRGEIHALPPSSLPQAGIFDTSLARETDAAIGRGLDWLASLQKEDGSWSDERFPALTALPLWAFVRDARPEYRSVREKAIRYILSCVQTNGGIYRDVAGQKGGGLSNYNTAICMTALHAAGDPALTPVIQNAREFMAHSQHLGGDVYSGGFGYDRETQRPYTDLLNTYYAVEAMRVTAGVEDLRAKEEPRADIDWKETVRYIERMQNPPSTGTNNAGGFFYNPTDPKAGTTTNRDGVVVFRSYGSITYAGMLALIYAQVTRDDVRIRSAFDWASRHWSLDENPGMGAQGMFFFYNILSKSLSAFGRDLIQKGDRSLIDWRKELARKLIETQKTDPKTGYGYWQNDIARYWEGDPVLVTSYCLQALQIARGPRP